MLSQLESSLARKGGRDEGEIETGRKGWDGQTALVASQQCRYDFVTNLASHVRVSRPSLAFPGVVVQSSRKQFG